MRHLYNTTAGGRLVLPALALLGLGLMYFERGFLQGNSMALKTGTTKDCCIHLFALQLFLNSGNTLGLQMLF